MTGQTQNSHGILEAWNYQDEQCLNHENKKTLRKMMKYVRTFPLKSIEIEKIRRDLIGMAIEAQKRNSSLQTVLGEKPRKFCDGIIYSIGGIRAPGGRKLLHIAGGYYQLIGSFAIVEGLIAFFAFLVIAGGQLLNTGSSDIRLTDFVSALVSLAIGILYYTAGKRAWQYATDVTKAKPALHWGIGMLTFDFSYNFLSLARLLTTQPRPLSTCISWMIWLADVLFLVFPALYILGAYRNRPHSGTP